MGDEKLGCRSRAVGAAEEGCSGPVLRGAPIPIQLATVLPFPTHLCTPRLLAPLSQVRLLQLWATGLLEGVKVRAGPCMLDPGRQTPTRQGME